MEGFFKWISRIVTVLGIPAILTIGGVMLSEIHSLNREIGVLHGQMKAIDVQFEHAKEDRARIQKDQAEAIAGMNRRLEDLEETVRFSQADLERILVNLGTVSEGEVFDAAIIGESVWVFPADQALVDRLEGRGLRRMQVNSAISGYKVVPVSALTDQ